MKQYLFNLKNNILFIGSFIVKKMIYIYAKFNICEIYNKQFLKSLIKIISKKLIPAQVF